MMLRINKTRKGFTLVEIMIVVAIIALLAAIAVPNFLRARQRSQATRVLDELRLIDAAIDQYAIENNKKRGDTISWAAVRQYIKEGTALYNNIEDASAVDAIGNAMTVDTIGAGIRVSGSTAEEFDGIVAPEFWGAYAPTVGGGTALPPSGT